MSERTLARPARTRTHGAHARTWAAPDLGPAVVDLRDPRPAGPAGLVEGAWPDPAPVDRASDGPSAARPRPHQFPVVWADGGVATAVAAATAGLAVLQGHLSWPALLASPLLGLVWVAAMWVARAYEERILWAGSAELHRVAIGAGLAGLAVLGAGWTLLPAALAQPALSFLGGATVLTVLLRRVVRSRAQAANRAGTVRLRVLAVGPTADVDAVTARIHRNGYHGWSMVGTLTVPERGSQADGSGALDAAGVRRAAQEASADVVLLCQGTSVRDLQGLDRIQWELEADGRELAIAPPLVEAIGPRVSVPTICGLPIIRIGQPELTGARRLFKSAADRAAALLAVVVLSPLLLGVAAAVRLTSPGPALFRQERIGLHGRPFTMVKFRSMYTDAEARKADLVDGNEGAGPLFKLRDDPRITPVGALLRRTSLDELPQLLNILRGDMSVVGPRPALADEVRAYDDGARRRLMVRPGLTGLWQVHGRSDLPWAETRRLDVRYVENWSVGFDLAIIGRTVEAVVRGRGAY